MIKRPDKIVKPRALVAALLLVLLLAGCRVDLALPEGPEPPPSATAAPGWPREGFTTAQVERVVDGDTIVVSIGGQEYTLRYIGIDTPETVRPDYPQEWMGPEATAANEALVQGQTVYLEKDVSETDRYGRLLRYVYLADGTMVNAELVRQGYAHASAYPPDVKHQELLDAAEREAREAERGLWGPAPEATAEPTQGGTVEQTPEDGASPNVALTSQPGAGGGGVVIAAIHYPGDIVHPRGTLSQTSPMSIAPSGTMARQPSTSTQGGPSGRLAPECRQRRAGSDLPGVPPRTGPDVPRLHQPGAPGWVRL